MAKPGSELVGRTFLHKHWLDPVAMPEKVPAEFKITAVRNGQVYIRPIYDKGGSNERLGNGMYRPLTTFEQKDVLRWTNPGRGNGTGRGSKTSKSDAQEYYKGHAIFKGVGGGYYVPTLPLSNYPTLEGARKAIDKRMSDRKGNPGLADEISEGFHGRKVSERFEVEEEELYPDNLAVLGCLVELSIISGSGVIPIRGFKNPYSPGYRKGDEVYLAAADRNNLEFVGGDQEIVNADKIAQHTNKTLVKLGKVKSIVYLADKHHLVGSNGKEEEYEHDFGKKRYFLFGKQVGQPELLYDCLNKTMKLVGGTYTITDEGIKD